MLNSYKFFSNKSCEYYPCHDLEEQNCLFCYCPLYYIEDCGGDYNTLGSGLKDCSTCTIPHISELYDYIIEEINLYYQK